ncbi:hypothetical protein PJI16_02090 [Nitrospira sp. MA-1]|nr:hypothetical protein [Nitrospira sp. MA-1]
MTDSISESAIVRAVAEQAARRITRKVISVLQMMSETLAGDDSDLKTSWDEICVQVQIEASFSWDAYDETVRHIVEGHIVKLLKHEREAIWLQTDAGWDWAYEESADREADPEMDDDIVDYLTREYVYAEAGHWSNARIRALIER